MNAIEIIKIEHREVEKLFDDYKKASEKSEKEDVVENLIMALEHHTEMEETYLYPKLRKDLESDGEELVEEAYKEHEEAKELLQELSSAEDADENMDSIVSKLEEAIAHHVEEEEAELLPKAEEKLSKEELASIGKEFKKLREEHGM